MQFSLKNKIFAFEIKFRSLDYILLAHMSINYYYYYYNSRYHYFSLSTISDIINLQ